MFLGIPKGLFYYDYYSFIKKLFDGTGVKIIDNVENTDMVLSLGCDAVVDEACMPIKLVAGQIRVLLEKCDAVFIPKLMKDINGMWYCPKQMGVEELVNYDLAKDKIIFTDPIYMNNKKAAYKSFSKVGKILGIDNFTFKNNFVTAYNELKLISHGISKMHVESDWEFTPKLPKKGEIILPNTSKVFLAGHCYNVFDSFANNNIIKKLDDLCIGVITEKVVSYPEKRHAVDELKLMKTPFWESVIRVLGSAICLKEDVDGIIYVSSFSCGPDSLIIELIKKYVYDVPLMVIKLDEHKGTAGFETRLEAFSDLLERKRIS